jgi:hypothetical protein
VYSTSNSYLIEFSKIFNHNTPQERSYLPEAFLSCLLQQACSFYLMPDRIHWCRAEFSWFRSYAVKPLEALPGEKAPEQNRAPQ